VPTALLPAFLSQTLGLGAARAAGALGVIEGIADGASGVARFAGGPLADDPARRRATAVGGYATTAVFSSLIGVTTAAWQVGVLRSLAWAARGIRGPSRNALLADIAPPSAYGRAYGFERAMDNLGAIGGPLLAIGLVALVGVRKAILISFIPGEHPAARAPLRPGRTRDRGGGDRPERRCRRLCAGRAARVGVRPRRGGAGLREPRSERGCRRTVAGRLARGRVSLPRRMEHLGRDRLRRLDACSRLTLELPRPQAEERQEMRGRPERVRQRRAAAERQRRDHLAADLGEDKPALRGCMSAELRQPLECGI